MGTRQHADFADDLADSLGVSAINARACVQNGATDHITFQAFEGA